MIKGYSILFLKWNCPNLNDERIYHPASKTKLPHKFYTVPDSWTRSMIVTTRAHQYHTSSSVCFNKWSNGKCDTENVWLFVNQPSHYCNIQYSFPQKLLGCWLTLLIYNNICNHMHLVITQMRIKKVF